MSMRVCVCVCVCVEREREREREREIFVKPPVSVSFVLVRRVCLQ